MFPLGQLNVAERMVCGGVNWEVGHASSGTRTHLGTGTTLLFAEGTSARMIKTYFLHCRKRPPANHRAPRDRQPPVPYTLTGGVQGPTMEGPLPPKSLPVHALLVSWNARMAAVQCGA